MIFQYSIGVLRVLTQFDRIDIMPGAIDLLTILLCRLSDHHRGGRWLASSSQSTVLDHLLGAD